MKPSTLFVLGADDPEMREMERILAWEKRNFQYAMKDGKRVHPGNAYQADRIENADQVICIECQPTSVLSMFDVIFIDHHRPGDRGYGLPPSQFWQASSLGQLCEYLGVSMEVGSHDNVVLAAMDHCPAAAIRGECPDVTAEEVLNRKVEEIAKAIGVSGDAVRDRISELSERLETAPIVEIGGQGLKDMRAYDTGSGYSLDYLCSQVAALASGYGVLLLTHDRGDSREKWTIVGHCTPQCVESFIKEWAPAQGLTGIYGVPNRGYAGGYLPLHN